MAGMKEIRVKIKSVQNTRKITKAMEMVAASKMRKAQERMRAARPYGDTVRVIAGHLRQANPEYTHPFLVKREPIKRVGLILVTTDKGLCGGLNTNMLRLVTHKIRDAQEQEMAVKTVAIGSKGHGFLGRMGAPVYAHATQLGDTPRLEKLIGPVKVLLDAFAKGELSAVYLCYTRFINTMQQEPVVECLLPLERADIEREDEPEHKQPEHDSHEEGAQPVAYTGKRDYIYEPDPQTVIDDLLVRYVESLVYQAVAENMASEQSARTVAMKAASDNAKSVIDEFKLLYNKTRQASITTELSEIVAGAAAV